MTIPNNTVFALSQNNNLSRRNIRLIFGTLDAYQEHIFLICKNYIHIKIKHYSIFTFMNSDTKCAYQSIAKSSPVIQFNQKVAEECLY